MGLAGPKNRTKISQDPNNTQWAKSTTSFGHRMLASQGWTPGSTLGSKDAQHKSHFTQASHSHIRVVLRDDNLGIGAQKGRADTDVFGLDMFQGLLGRLNGKSQEELEKEGKVRRDVLLGAVGRERYGDGMFVRGGWLVGDKIEDVVGVEEAERLAEVRLAHERRVEEAKGGMEEVEGKKRKRDGEEGEKKSKKSKSVLEGAAADDKSTKRSKKDKKRKSEVISTDSTSTESAGQSSSETTAKSEKKRLKAEKRARKEARRIRREQKALKKSSTSNSSSSSSSPEPPSVQQAAAQQALSARFATRQRYIQQKRMATMDQTALNEIFMIKAKN